MSRCFPFLPPGYVLNGTRDEAVIVSIKGAQEKAKKEQRRKERKDKKEKKDKKDKKEKKEKKRKEREGKEGVSEKHSQKRRRKEEGAKDGANQKVDPFHKLKESETNCLEKSSLTVERELLQSTSQNSCDSTLNSNEILPKQKEKQQPLDGRHNNNQKQKEKQQPLDVRHNNNNDSESIIRIRLPIRRQKDPEVMMMTNKDQEKPGPSRGIKFDSSQVATREPVNQHPCSTSAPEHPSKPREEKRKDPVFRGKLGKGKISSSSTPDTYQPRKSLCNCPPSMVLQFLNVVENWVPNTIERRVDLINSEDEECWWSKKKPSSPTEICNQLNRNSEIKPVSNSMGWPCARLLPEADVYALPYTVPF